MLVRQAQARATCGGNIRHKLDASRLSGQSPASNTDILGINSTGGDRAQLARAVPTHTIEHFLHWPSAAYAMPGAGPTGSVYPSFCADSPELSSEITGRYPQWERIRTSQCDHSDYCLPSWQS